MLGICVTTIWSGATIQVLLQRNAVPDVQIFFIECLCFLHEIGLRKDGNIKGSKSIVSPVSHTFLKIIPISLNILGKRLPKQYRALNTTTKSNMTVRDYLKMQPFTGVPSKSCSDESHIIYRKTSMQESLL